MASDFEKAQKGQPWTPPTATTHNAMVDAALAQRQAGGAKGGRGSERGRITATVLVQNVSGEQRLRYDAVAVVDVATIPDSSNETDPNTIEFTNRIVLKVDIPTDADAGRWLVLMDDLADERFGIACAVGAVQCWINLQNTEDRAVDVEGGSAIPKSGDAGNQILWVDGGVGTATATGEQWAVIRIGGASAADSLGEFQWQLLAMVSANQRGWTFGRLHGLINNS